MDEQLAAIREAIKALEEVDRVAAPGTPQKDISAKIDQFFGKLQGVHAAGSENYLPVPLEALKFLDESEDVSNPWLYTHKQAEGTQQVAQKLADREQYLQNIEQEVTKSIPSEK